MEKVGKMVLKTKPWKSGTNKLSLSRQFRAACKKLERLNLTFLRTQFIFRKGQGIYWKKFFARKGPLPLPNRFLRPTRVHLDKSVTCGAWVLLAWFVNCGLGAIGFKACGTRKKRAPGGCSFYLLECLVKRYLMNFVGRHKSNMTKLSVSDQ